MSAMSAILRIETEAYDEPIDAYKDVQTAINAGSSSWCLQGSFGRTMMGAIEEGYCMLGRNPARDYWGNRIPSRDEVQPGTKGSYQYVADRLGNSWADTMANVSDD